MQTSPEFGIIGTLIEELTSKSAILLFTLIGDSELLKISIVFYITSSFLTHNCILFYWDYGIYPRWVVGVSWPPPVCFLVDPSCSISVFFCVSGCYLVFPCRSMFRIGLSALGWLRGWGGVRTLSGLRISWRAYLKRLSPFPSSYCGRWTLILCAGTLDPPDAPVCGPHQCGGNPTPIPLWS